MSKRYEPPQFEPDACEPARIGRALLRAYSRLEEMEEVGITERRRPAKEERRSYVDAAERHADDRVQALRLALSCHQAMSSEGCLAQIVQAISLTSGIVDDLTPDDPKDEDLYRVKADHRALLRLLYSVLNHLEAMTRCDAEAAFGARHLAPDHFDPWRLIEKRLEIVRH
jgi:hypothetical protein